MRGCGSLGNLNVFGIFVLLLIFSYIHLETSTREASTRYVHWDWLIIHTSGGIRQVELRSRSCWSLLVLISMTEEAWPLLLVSECVLECPSGRIIVLSAYSFD